LTFQKNERNRDIQHYGLLCINNVSDGSLSRNTENQPHHMVERGFPIIGAYVRALSKPTARLLQRDVFCATVVSPKTIFYLPDCILKVLGT